MKTWTIYTDGSCWPNPGPGGWGAVLMCDQERIELYGASIGVTTNNRMEITAAISALNALKEPARVDLWTDSQYLSNGGSAWCKRWAAMDWKHGKRHGSKPIPNMDLWKELMCAMEPHQIRWHWLKGHSGHAENERCDELAAAAKDKKP